MTPFVTNVRNLVKERHPIIAGFGSSVQNCQTRLAKWKFQQDLVWLCLNYARNATRRTGSLTGGAAAPWAGATISSLHAEPPIKPHARRTLLECKFRASITMHYRSRKWAGSYFQPVRIKF